MATYIDDVDDWDDFANGILVDPNNEYELTNDIGDSTNPVTTMYSGIFTGRFDGRNNKITVAITSNATNVGLFSQVQGGVIQNLIIDGQVTGGIYSQNVGGFVGQVGGGQFHNCTNLAEVTGNSPTSSVGGIIGKTVEIAEIFECTNNGTITGGRYVAGIAGSNNIGFIFFCRNAGTIKSNYGTQCMAGIVGFAGLGHTNIHGAVNIGKILSSNSIYAGGIVARLENSNIIESFNSGIVEGAIDSVGGIVGIIRQYGVAVNNINTNWINGIAPNSGAIVGYNDINGMVYNCYFDEQMSVLTVGIGNNPAAPSTMVEGRPTSGMIGPPATGGLPFANPNTPPQLYPILDGNPNPHPIALLAAAPIYLQNNEKVDDVITPFYVSNWDSILPFLPPPPSPIPYEYQWTSLSNGTIISVPLRPLNNATINGSGQDVLEVQFFTVSNGYKKNVPITVL